MWLNSLSQILNPQSLQVWVASAIVSLMMQISQLFMSVLLSVFSV
tara:strand:- start:34 stop:168 length:135 start_codon:yes stop_codon:yes gene_type:complete